MPGLLDHASADGTLFDIGDYDYGEWRRLLAERTRQDPRDMDDGLVRDIVDDLGPTRWGGCAPTSSFRSMTRG